jgi:hypothetical protein
MASLSRYARLADFREQLSFRHRFGEALTEVCKLLRAGGSPGLVLLIDDLDRCPPNIVATVLEAISFCVGAGPCLVVLGMDRRQVEFAVGESFKDIVEGIPDDELDMMPGEVVDERNRCEAFARRYLEKLINLEVPIPALDEEGLRGLLRPELAKPPFEEGPVWLSAVSGTARFALQFARVLFVAVFVGLLMSAGIDKVQHAPAPSNAPGSEVLPPTGAPASSATGTAAGPPPSVQTTVRQPMLIDIPFLEVPSSDGPGAGRWIWWGPTLLVIFGSMLWLLGLTARRRATIVQDSPRFARALEAVEPFLMARRMTPRLVKRFQNRMRYLAERMRVQRPDVDRCARRKSGADASGPDRNCRGSGH